MIGNVKGFSQSFFLSIQEAINEAENDSTIIIPSGLYREHVIVNKTVSLVGVDASATIVDGTNNGTAVQITADNVSISGLTLRNSGCLWEYSGISISGSKNCEVKNCYFFNNCHNINISHSNNCRVFGNTINGKCYGIRLTHSINCTVFDNHVSNCYGGIILSNATKCIVKKNNITSNGYGIRFDSPCTYNRFFANDVSNNGYDGLIAIMPPNSSFVENILFHNNFVDNGNPFTIQTAYGFLWDSGYLAGGNYWSRYSGTDMYHGPNQNVNGSDGLGDTPYMVKDNLHRDRYPLIHPWSPLPVHNINTGLGYTAIQEALDANESLIGHTIYVESGIYSENVVIDKSVSILGEAAAATIIDGCKTGTVLTVKANYANVSGFTLRNSGENYLSYGNGCGIFLDHSRMVNISNNIIWNNCIGIYLFFSRENSMENNVISHNQENGLWLWYSGENTLKGNKILGNSYNFGVFGGSFSDYNNTVDASNEVNGKRIIYRIGVKDEVFDAMEVGALYLINCKNVTLRNLNLSRNGHGIFCYNITNSKIEHALVSENNYGIQLQESHNNVLVNNQCQDNWVGISLYDSANNVVENNLAVNNEKGVSLYDAIYNILTGNTIKNNVYGIRLYNSHFNKVFHNNLLENVEQVSLIAPSYVNSWDNGLEGNFWSDYKGSDSTWDGLGDIEQKIDEENCDRYPLMGVFQNYHIHVEDKSYSVAVVSNSTIFEFLFDEINHTIKLTVNGTDKTYGFCRISIPNFLITPETMVIIDNITTKVLHANYTIYDDGFYRCIYFAYLHPVHEIRIIKGFSTGIFLPILIVTVLSCLLFCKLLFYKFKKMK